MADDTIFNFKRSQDIMPITARTREQAILEYAQGVQSGAIADAPVESITSEDLPKQP